MADGRHIPLNLKQLQAFVWVADLGSFRRAAECLNTTQPNISARIAGLEAALGVTLMERDAGSVRLTPKGRELLEHTRGVLNAADALIVAADAGTQFDGVLRLGVTEMIVQTWLREFMRRLREAFPRLLIELTVDLSVNLEAELFARSIDLALQNEPFSRVSTGSLDLGRYPLIWVAAPVLGLHGKPVVLDDLAAHPILTHARNTRWFAEVTAHFAQRRDLSPRFVPSSNLSACQHMTLDGMGVAALPQAMVAADLARGDLVAIGYDWVPEALHFFARYDAQRAPVFVTQAAQVAVDVAGQDRKS